MGDKKEILESRDRVICNLVVETPKTRWTIGGRGRGRSGGCDAPKAHLQITKDGGESRAVAMDGIPGVLAGATRLSRRPKNHDFVAAEVYIIREN